MATIVKSIRASGGDYSTIASWESDLDNDTPYDASDIAQGELYNEVYDEVAINFDGGSTLGLTGWHLTVASGERHDGTAGSGARVVPTTGSGTVFDILAAGSLTKEMSWFEMNGNSRDYSELIDQNTGGGNGAEVTLRHLLLHNVAVTSTGPSAAIEVTDNRATRIYRCTIYDINRNHNSADSAWGIRSQINHGSVRDLEIYNCIVHNVVNQQGSGNAYGIQLNDDADGHVINCHVTDTSGSATGTIQDYSLSSPANAEMDYNIASDTSASGANSTDSVSSSDEFTSTTPGSEDLRLKAGATAIDDGNDLSGTGYTEIAVGIQGNTVSGTWDIGSDERSDTGATLTVVAPTVGMSVPTATLSPGAVSLTAAAPTVGLSVPDATVSQASILTVDAPTVALGAPDTIVSAGAATLSADSPTVGLSVPTAVVSPTVTLTVDSPVVALSVPDAAVSVGNVLSAAAPTVALSVPDAAVSVSAVTLTVDAPIVALSVPTATSSPSITLSADSPTIGLSVPDAAIDASGDSTLSADAPTIAVSAPTVTVSVSAITLTVDAPIAALSVPDATLNATITRTADAPTIAASVPTATLSPGAVSLVVTSPTIGAIVPTASISGGTELPDNLLETSITSAVPRRTITLNTT